MARRVFVTVCGLLLAHAVPQGQNRPDFSGTWTFNATLTAGPAVAGASTGQQITWPTTLEITQSASDIEVRSSTRQQFTQRLPLKFDGSESTVMGGGDITIRAASGWEGDRLIVKSRRSFASPLGEVVVELKEAYGLVDGNLVVERTETQAGKPATRRIVYSKGAFDPQSVAVAAPTRTHTAGPVSRLANGRPDFEGYWVGDSSASWSVEAHQAGFGLAGGKSLIVDPPDGNVPYQPWALAERERRRHDLYNDPEPHCFPSGVPRQMAVGMPYQILQLEKQIVFVYEYVHARRIINMDQPHTPTRVRFWQGDSVGRWDGDTLVVDTDHFTDKTWLDMDGNFFSERGRVVERMTPLDANTFQYRATIDDPGVFTRPWTLQFCFSARLGRTIRSSSLRATRTTRI
jgi:hypothetical protein